jgi:regulator of protease activity HflC (stomatin/prohibitin superfamily)
MSNEIEIDKVKRWHIGLSSLSEILYKNRARIILRTLVILAFIIVIWPYVTIVIPAGQVGVLFRPLFGGTSTSRPLGEGLNLFLPWNRVTLYDSRIQFKKSSFEAVTADGLHINIGIVYRYRIHTSVVGRLHKIVGPNFPAILMDPAINSVVRLETSKYLVGQIYSELRKEVQENIYKRVVDSTNRNMISASTIPSPEDDFSGKIALFSLNKETEKNYAPLVELVDIQITEVRLPDRVRQAIEKKEEQEQLQLEYRFRIEREKLESQRKRIEAIGIRDFQLAVQAGISDNYLRWRGIEATLQLATSPNSKTVIIGGGRTGMPLILNTDDTRSSAPPAPRRVGSGKTQASGRADPSDSIDLSADTEQGTLEVRETSKKLGSPRDSQ